MEKNNSLNKLLLNQVRLKIMSALIAVEACDFNYLKEVTESTQGNLSIHIKKLEQEGYLNVKKSFEKNYPKTTCNITEKGKQAFETFFAEILLYRNK